MKEITKLELKFIGYDVIKYVYINRKNWSSM